MNSEDATLAAVCTVTFDVDGGSTVPGQTVARGGKAARPADPVKEGCAFVGWFTDAAKTAPWDFDTGTVTEDTMIYAKWIVSKTFTISFGEFTDEEINLNQEGRLALSKSRYDSLTFILSGVESYDSIWWYKDGDSSGISGKRYTIYASGFTPGPHTLNVVVIKGGVPYSKTFTFTVST
ncbi:MAG: InlB B-repeat-containing protein [Treponema sp.]|nr:InlB B-repeat-containing protein [Treponema sp.]